MIRFQYKAINTIEDARSLLQLAITVEFSTLPPYLYALYSIFPGTNAEASGRIRAVALQEMIHMCLGCNTLNALGGNPIVTAPTYPGPLPGDIGSEGREFTVHILPFSKDSMAQGMQIEEPEDGPIVFPEAEVMLAEPTFMTIGQFYHYLDRFLATLPASAWSQGRNQIDDNQFFAGELFADNNYVDAQRAIGRIVSQGEGSKTSPLDFEKEVAHYYRFEEVFRNQLLTKADTPLGYTWAGELGVDWSAVDPAISDPSQRDFSNDPPAAQAAQDACDEAFTRMVQELQKGVNGESGSLGNAVRAMFDLRMAAHNAFTTPLAVSGKVAGPSFRIRPGLVQTSRKAS